MKEVKLPFVPALDYKDGLNMLWKPSKRWLKNHPYELPYAKTNINSGQQIYFLPRELHKEDIFMTSYPDIQVLGKIIKPHLK